MIFGKIESLKHIKARCSSEKKIRRISPKIGLISTGSRGGWNGELPKLSMESQLTAFIPRRPEAESILSHGVMVLI